MAGVRPRPTTHRPPTAAGGTLEVGIGAPGLVPARGRTGADRRARHVGDGHLLVRGRSRWLRRGLRLQVPALCGVDEPELPRCRWCRCSRRRRRRPAPSCRPPTAATRRTPDRSGRSPGPAHRGATRSRPPAFRSGHAARSRRWYRCRSRRPRTRRRRRTRRTSRRAVVLSVALEGSGASSVVHVPLICSPSSGRSESVPEYFPTPAQNTADTHETEAQVALGLAPGVSGPVGASVEADVQPDVGATAPAGAAATRPPIATAPSASTPDNAATAPRRARRALVSPARTRGPAGDVVPRHGSPPG